MASFSVQQKHSAQFSQDDEAYIFSIKKLQTENGSYVLTSDSSNNLLVFGLGEDTMLQPLVKIQGHTQTINDFCYLPQSNSVVATASSDGLIRLWDFRTSSLLQTYPTTNNSVECFSCSFGGPNNTLLAGAFGSSILCWDFRANKIIQKYEESHTEDITSLKFHPITQNLFSSSMDGLICCFDLSQPEDDALVLVLNQEQPVIKFDFFGSNFENIHSLTSVESFTLWNMQQERKILEVTDARQATHRELDYLIDFQYDFIEGQLTLFGGYSTGEVEALAVDWSGTKSGKNSLSPLFSLSGGHSAVVRSLIWSKEQNQILTGGEDSLILNWKANAPSSGKVSKKKSANRAPY